MGGAGVEGGTGGHHIVNEEEGFAIEVEGMARGIGLFRIDKALVALEADLCFEVGGGSLEEFFITGELKASRKEVCKAFGLIVAALAEFCTRAGDGDEGVNVDALTQNFVVVGDF